MNDQWLIQEWTERFSKVMESMTGEPVQVSFGPESMRLSGSVLWWEQAFTLDPNAPLWIGAADEAWKQLGNQVLIAAGVDDGDEETIRSTYSEILSQSLASVAQTMSGKAKREVSCPAGQEGAPESPDEAGFLVEIGLGSIVVGLSVVVSAALNKALQKAVAEAEKPGAKSKASSGPAPSVHVTDAYIGALTPAGAGSDKSRPLDLLLDVELPISVSFGRAQLPLKDVIKLTTGSIVELNRTVNEPVEVIVNNCVIARGEVVVVEGNFGVRIKQIVSRQERLRTLK